MGNPSYDDDKHAMCFNGAKSWELNWYGERNGYRSFNPKAVGSNPISAKMAALDDYLKGNTTTEHSLVLQIYDISQANDYYSKFRPILTAFADFRLRAESPLTLFLLFLLVMYNRKKGVNSEVVEYGDQVTITHGRAGALSKLVGHLSLLPGQTSKLELENFGGGTDRK
jgi:hypothetical protein